MLIQSFQSSRFLLTYILHYYRRGAIGTLDVPSTAMPAHRAALLRPCLAIILQTQITATFLTTPLGLVTIVVLIVGSDAICFEDHRNALEALQICISVTENP